MPTFEQREKEFEAKFVADQEAQFVAHAHQIKLLGQWAAQKMGLTGDDAETYAKTLISVDVEKGRSNVVPTVIADLAQRGIKVSRAEVLDEVTRLLGKK